MNIYGYVDSIPLSSTNPRGLDPLAAPSCRTCFGICRGPQTAECAVTTVGLTAACARNKIYDSFELGIAESFLRPLEN